MKNGRLPVLQWPGSAESKEIGMPPSEDQPTPGAKKPYEKPRVESHRVFEASLACIKIPGSPMCSFNIHRTKS
jgi:hypothetical protein